MEGGRGGEREKEIEEDNTTTSTKKQYDKKTHKNTKEQKGKTNNSIHDGPFEAVCDKLHLLSNPFKKTREKRKMGG